MDFYDQLKNNFCNSIIANIDGKIMCVFYILKGHDLKSNTEYYVYRDIISENNFIRFEEIKGKKISNYLYKKEFDSFENRSLEPIEILNIIARAIKYEQDILYFKEQEKKDIKVLNH